jgi:hypothetical protein
VFNLRGTQKKNTELKTLSRRDARAFMRLRLGHTNLTHSYLFDRGRGKPICDCGDPLDADHLLNCKKRSELRKQLNFDQSAALIGDSYERAKETIEYLKQTKILNKI